MLIFKRLLYDKGQQWIRDQLAGHEAFLKIREDYINACIRLVRECRSFTGPRKRDWYDAALWLLEVADEELQSDFLQAEDDERDAWINAIIHDHGFSDERGRWFELPELPA